MSTERPAAVTDADIRSLAAKLKGLYALLTPPEQAMLRTLLRRAAATGAGHDADVAGVLWGVSFDPFRYLDAIDLSADGARRARRRRRLDGR